MTKKALIVVMRVSGSGKSTVAQLLAKQLNLPFLEGDDFHSSEAKQQMAKGVGLSDAQREPWIDKICEQVHSTLIQENGVILACSALRKTHRERFRLLAPHCNFVFLHADKPLIVKRLKARQAHFANEHIINSQFDSLQLPENESDIMQFTINLPSAMVADKAIIWLAQKGITVCP